MTEIRAGFAAIALRCPDAQLGLARGFLDRGAADALLGDLKATLPWTQHRLRLFGREVQAPRLSAWIGDPEAHYRYSGSRFEPEPWTPALLGLREALQTACGTPFNSVLANRYRDGRDSMGWHADDEPELGDSPLIASLSLGATRRFLLRSRHDDERIALDLGHGDLLLMAGSCQRDYRHAVAKTARPCDERINLTFRWILPSPAPARRPATSR